MKKFLLLSLIFCACNMYELAGDETQLSEKFQNTMDSLKLSLKSDQGVNLNFPDADAGNSSSLVLNLTNTSSGVITFGSPTSGTKFGFNGAFPGAGGTCSPGGNLAQGSSCLVDFSFTPSSGGFHDGVVEIPYSDSEGSHVLKFFTEGRANGFASLSILGSNPYVFPDTSSGGTTNHTLTIKNNGEQVATGVFAGTLSPPFDFVGGTYPGGGSCGTTLNPGESCTIIIKFSPTSVGIYSGYNLNVDYNNGLSVITRTLGLQGTAP